MEEKPTEQAATAQTNTEQPAAAQTNTEQPAAAKSEKATAIANYMKGRVKREKAKKLAKIIDPDQVLRKIINKKTEGHSLSLSEQLTGETVKEVVRANQSWEATGDEESDLGYGGRF